MARHHVSEVVNGLFDVASGRWTGGDELDHTLVVIGRDVRDAIDVTDLALDDRVTAHTRHPVDVDPMMHYSRRYAGVGLSS